MIEQKTTNPNSSGPGILLFSPEEHPKAQLHNLARSFPPRRGKVEVVVEIFCELENVLKKSFATPGNSFDFQETIHLKA